MKERKRGKRERVRERQTERQRERQKQRCVRYPTVESMLITQPIFCKVRIRGKNFRKPPVLSAIIIATDQISIVIHKARARREYGKIKWKIVNGKDNLRTKKITHSSLTQDWH